MNDDESCECHDADNCDDRDEHDWIYT